MPKRILLADDSITIQKVVELTFSDGDYEVSAVNNGAKAIQKLSEMRPDIILSDIIMPEKNGYEVCEYVKSHPDYRNIPVVLLTGTFEPFDPDRAEKAGCDAVVTKPFESQSLIHKVEELIAQSQAHSAPAATVPAFAPPPPEEPAMSPWMEEPAPSAPLPSEGSPFSTSGGSVPLPPMEAFSHGADLFSAPALPDTTTEMPFESPAESPFGAPPPAEEFSGETRAFPRMSFEEMQQMAAPPAAPAFEPPPSAPEPSPWDEPSPASPFASAPEPESPFGAPPPAEEFSGETRAFPKMSFEEMQQMVAPPPAPEPEPEPEPLSASEPSPWDEAPMEPVPPSMEPAPWESEAPAFSGETRAFPKMSFEELHGLASPPAQPEPEPEPASPSMSWDEPEPMTSDAMSHDSMMQDSMSQDSMSHEPMSHESMSMDEPAQEWAPAETSPEPSFDSAPMADELPFASEASAEPESLWGEPEPVMEQEPEPEPAPSMPAALAPEAPPMAIAAHSGDLTDEQVDRIARRVVELMSTEVIRNIAWEVVPDLAEMAVKERIRQLEAEG